MKTKVLTLLYFFIGILFIVLPDQSGFLMGLVVKTLIIPVLMFLFIINRRPCSNLFCKLMFAGLFFSWGGDVILEAHIMYLIVFFKTPGKNVIFNNRIYLLAPVLIYGVALTLFLYNDLGAMRLPVILYAIVILIMLAGAINRIEKVNRVSYYMVLAGAILFVISDSAIAINKFSIHFESSGIVIMSTYIIAQYLIVSGYIKQFRNNQK
jgi:uncharacterized membrane protein YhhN